MKKETGRAAALAGAAAVLWGSAAAAAEPAGRALPDEPINTWVLKSRTPNHVYENDLAYDPNTGQIVYHGGHVGKLYPQSNYTFLYDVARNRWRESQSPCRPQRRCYNNMAYLDSARMCLTAQGSRGHGSLPQGGFTADTAYKECIRRLNAGPWLYDGPSDLWQDMRPLPPRWANKDLANIVYDPSSDVAFYFYARQMVQYCPRINRISVRFAPDEIMERDGYAIAADPIRRKIVFFGGRHYGKVAAEADRFKADTWIYEPATNRWRQVATKAGGPPSGVLRQFVIGLTMVYHDPSDSMLMVVNPVRGVPPEKGVPPAELWSFNLDTEQWSQVPVEGDRPARTGIAAYARNEDLLVILGGGSDGGTRDHGRDVRTCRVRVPGAIPAIPARPERIQLAAGEGSNVLSWQADEGAAYDIYRAECAGLRGKTSRLYSADSEIIQQWKKFQAARLAAREASKQPGGNRDEFERLDRMDVWGPDADPVPGEYVKIGQVKAEVVSRPNSALKDVTARFEDRNVVAGAVYAYRVAPAGAKQRPSLPAFNQPWHPSGLQASVEDAKKVVLRWDPNRESDIVGYRVYRAIGAEIEDGTGKLLTPEPLKATELTVTDDDLGDRVVRFYWVTTVNRAGVESGASPLATSFPEAPTALHVIFGEGLSNNDGLRLGEIISWEWPKDVKVAGFNVYYSNHHRNGFNGPGGTYDADWKKITPKPITGTEYAFTLDQDDPHMHSYFHVRAVNVLGQEGYYTDIISPSDYRFRGAW
ncbi:MAG: hypothetical protein C0404_10445 [Verrucomicrobia bacterium]|nr:hypothetical protein [Verrucomicrobiota bacterium]